MNTKCFYIGLAIWTIIFVSLGFAEDFQNRPTLTELNEVVNQAIECGNAVIERDVVVSRNQNFFPYCGHGQSYFASLQTELENLPPLYIDHISGPLTTNQTDFLYFTLSIWQEAAGLNTNGFRRATEQGGGFSYGYAQAGDVIGDWIYEDIEAGVSVLRWSKRIGGFAERDAWSTGSPSTYVFGYSSSEYYNNWNASSWRGVGSGFLYAVIAVHGYNDYNSYVINCFRYRCKVFISALPLTIAGTMDVYFFIEPTSNPPYVNFVDMDSLGLVEGKLNCFESGIILDGIATSKTTDYYGNFNPGAAVEPFSMIGGIPPPPPQYDDYLWGCYASGAPQLLMKWDFEN